MLDDGGDPADLFVPNDTGRFFMEDDVLAERLDEIFLSSPTELANQSSAGIAPESEIALYDNLFGEATFRAAKTDNSLVPITIYEVTFDLTADNLVDQDGDGQYSLIGISPEGSFLLHFRTLQQID